MPIMPSGTLALVPAKLYVLHGSHPCATAELALNLKGVAYKTVELPIASQPLVMRALRFGGRTVPAVHFEDGEKVQGSRAILAALDRRVPQPQLGINAEVAGAEQWGDEVLQDIPRRLMWRAFTTYPRAMHGFQAGAKGPQLPMAAVLALAPAVLAVERRLNEVNDATVRADLAALPGHLDRIDAWIAAGLLDGDQPNAADLQIAPSLRLLGALEDLRPLLADRPAQHLATRWLDPMPASVGVGALPAAWLPVPVPVAG